MNYVYLSVTIYVLGLVGWFFVWHSIVGGREWFKEVPLLYIPYWGAVVVFIVNAFLTSIAEIPEYGVEVGIYGFVEANAKSVAVFSLGIAIFIVVTFDKFSNIMDQEKSRKFIILLFTSFLIAVLGALPLYWVPQVFGWLTVLRHLKTIPYTYSIFIFAAAMLFFIHQVRESRYRKSAKEVDEKGQSTE